MRVNTAERAVGSAALPPPGKVKFDRQVPSTLEPDEANKNQLPLVSSRCGSVVTERTNLTDKDNTRKGASINYVMRFYPILNIPFALREQR